jgi:glutamate-1-semialdehyde 2,1-aminomutase
MPGGVSSPVRSFASVGGEPFFVVAGKGARIRDADRRSYIDFVQSYGPHLFGHAPEFLRRALSKASRRGTSFGAPTEAEIRLAERVVRMVPSVEMVRFVNSGTEATMSAARLARGATGRKRLVKVEGGYHGHADQFLVSAGSGVATRHRWKSGVSPRSGGADGRRSVQRRGRTGGGVPEVSQRIAAVILEPLAANVAGVVSPSPGYLEIGSGIDRRHASSPDLREVIADFAAGPAELGTGTASPGSDDARGRSSVESSGALWRKPIT